LAFSARYRLKRLKKLDISASKACQHKIAEESSVSYRVVSVMRLLQSLALVRSSAVCVEASLASECSFNEYAPCERRGHRCPKRAR
jgi:hypothetical protein